jgi:hypothetical protein
VKAVQRIGTLMAMVQLTSNKQQQQQQQQQHTLQGGCLRWMSSSCDGVLPAGFATITASTVSAGLGHLLANTGCVNNTWTPVASKAAAGAAAAAAWG